MNEAYKAISENAQLLIRCPREKGRAAAKLSIKCQKEQKAGICVSGVKEGEYIYIHTYICFFVYVCIYHMCIYVCVYTYICFYVYICVYMFFALPEAVVLSTINHFFIVLSQPFTLSSLTHFP